MWEKLVVTWRRLIPTIGLLGHVITQAQLSSSAAVCLQQCVSLRSCDLRPQTIGVLLCGPGKRHPATLDSFAVTCFCGSGFYAESVGYYPPVRSCTKHFAEKCTQQPRKDAVAIYVNSEKTCQHETVHSTAAMRSGAPPPKNSDLLS